MRLPRDIDSEQLVKALGRLGYRVARQTGSHIRLHCEEPSHSITVPEHRPIKVGTLSAILADVAERHEIEKSELIKRLFG
jgi:predicted RNA binding protein YcfA (HicA-like mRNA interferase family)